MSDVAITHVGFSDESNWNKGRFRSLGLVTGSVQDLPYLRRQLRQLLTDSGVSEFKWNKLDSAKERFAALKMCNFAVNAACERKLRVDVLIWDIQDSRHNVVGRDDIANLQRMYYHLFRNVLRRRWPDNAVWRLCPDEHTAMDWNTVQDCLESVADYLVVGRPLYTQGQFRTKLHRDFGLAEIDPVLSHKYPLLQLADLFAGMGVFSREQFNAYRAWLATTSKQPLLIEDNNGCTVDPSRSSRERFYVLQEFDKSCKKRRLGVSIKTRHGLWTPEPENPLNFWMYESQHSEDTAPKRVRP